MNAELDELDIFFNDKEVIKKSNKNDGIFKSYKYLCVFQVKFTNILGISKKEDFVYSSKEIVTMKDKKMIANKYKLLNDDIEKCKLKTIYLIEEKEV